MKRLIIIALLIATGCTSSAPATSAVVTLTEFAIGTSAAALVPGSVDLTVENAGEFGHTLVVTNELGEVVAATQLIGPGDSTTLSVDLDTGRFEFTCRIVFESSDGALVDHFEEGMRTGVTVGS